MGNGNEKQINDFKQIYKDDLSIISKETLNAVGETLINIIYNNTWVTGMS